MKGKLILYLCFAGLLAAPVILSSERPRNAGDSSEAIERFGFFLEEVSSETGIDFMHRPPQFDPKLDHIMPQIASMGASVSVVDFDRDGWQDLYVTNSGENTSNALYRNTGDGSFEDIAEKLGLARVNNLETGVSMGSVWGDYDNDGYEDLFLYKWGRQELYHNDAGKGFTRVSHTGLPEWSNVNAAIWLDYDRDGVLDLFFGSYYPEDLNLWSLSDTRIMPTSYEYAQNGGRKYLFRGNGDGTFIDKSDLLGHDTHRWMMAVSAADLRGTGYPDLVISNDYSIDEVFFNENGKRFRPAAERTRIGFVPKSGMNVSFGDILNQGRFSIYISNITEPGVLVQGNNLWVPRSTIGGDSLTYENMANTLGVEAGGWSYGAQFGDVNNDGTLDIVLTNGFYSGDRDRDYWYDFSKVTGGNREIISNAKNWPAMNGRSHSGYQQKRLWLNDGKLHFREVAQAVGLNNILDGRAVVFVDLWNRGVLDIVMAHQRGPLLVYKNSVKPENVWIEFELEGSQSNRSAIGARVELFWNGQQQVQEVSGGSGFCSQNQRRLHFGLGPDPVIEKAVIRWPSGQTQTLISPEPGRIHSIREPDVV